mmetsp:Transcript_17688/g.42917  ORF Transcript_17688/g.42917 Transcript_17688/m.42917 type:complete len:306 (-) Transcript_17688:199-1116(-)
MMLLFPTLGYPKKPTLRCFLSPCSTLNCLRSWISAPLPKGFVIDAWNASVGYSADRILIQRAVTHVGTRSHLLSSSTMCLWRAVGRLRSCSTYSTRVPIGSRTSSTWITTSEESTTLWSSAQMRLDWPLFMMFSRAASEYSMLSLRFESLFSSYPSSAASAFVSSSPRSFPASLGLFLLRFLLKVSSNDSTSSMRTGFVMVGSVRRDSGSFFPFSNTVYGSFTLFASSSLNWVSSFCPITRVFPNQRRLGATFACRMPDSGLTLCSGAFSLYISKRLTVALSRRLVCFFLLLRDISSTLRGFSRS